MSKAIISSLYDSDVFKMACRQFDQAADAIMAVYRTGGVRVCNAA